MVNSSLIINVMISASALYACSASSNSSSTSGALDVSANLASFLSSPAAAAAAKDNWAKASMLNPSEFGKQLIGGLSNNSFSVNGAVIGNVRDLLASRQAVFDRLDERYGSMSAAFADFHITVSFTSSAAALKQQISALQSSLKPQASLALQDATGDQSGANTSTADSSKTADNGMVSEAMACNDMRNAIIDWYKTDAYQNNNQSFADREKATADEEAYMKFQGSQAARDALSAQLVSDAAAGIDGCKLTGAANLHYSDGKHGHDGDDTADTSGGG